MKCDKQRARPPSQAAIPGLHPVLEIAEKLIETKANLFSDEPFPEYFVVGRELVFLEFGRRDGGPGWRASRTSWTGPGQVLDKFLTSPESNNPVPTGPCVHERYHNSTCSAIVRNTGKRTHHCAPITTYVHGALITRTRTRVCTNKRDRRTACRRLRAGDRVPSTACRLTRMRARKRRLPPRATPGGACTVAST